MMSLRIIACGAITIACVYATGCSAVATKTNTLTDERILSETGGVLGLPPAELTLVERNTQGLNTYVTIRDKNGKTYACTVNGGNLFSFGMTNPPICNPR